MLPRCWVLWRRAAAPASDDAGVGVCSLADTCSATNAGDTDRDARTGIKGRAVGAGAGTNAGSKEDERDKGMPAPPSAPTTASTPTSMPTPGATPKPARWLMQEMTEDDDWEGGGWKKEGGMN